MNAGGPRGRRAGDGLLPRAQAQAPPVRPRATGMAGAVPDLCRLCGERPATPSRAKHGDRRCKRCINRTPAGIARLARYNATPARKAIIKRHNARRIMLGAVYHSSAGSVDEARRINAHIKERTLELVKRQQDRAKTEGAAAR